MRRVLANILSLFFIIAVTAMFIGGAQGAPDLFVGAMAWSFILGVVVLALRLSKGEAS